MEKERMAVSTFEGKPGLPGVHHRRVGHAGPCQRPGGLAGQVDGGDAVHLLAFATGVTAADPAMGGHGHTGEGNLFLFDPVAQEL